jgi:two-component sensor histidine kinase
LPPGFDVRKSNSMGLQVVTALADQLDAQLEVESGEGTLLRLTFRDG